MNMTQIYLKLSTDTILRGNYGYTLNGEVFSNAKKTRPFDLSEYQDSKLRLRMFPKYEDVNIFDEIVDSVSGGGNENRFTYIVRQGDFQFEGTYNINLTIEADGVSISTIPEEFSVIDNGSGLR